MTKWCSFSRFCYLIEPYVLGYEAGDDVYRRQLAEEPRRSVVDY